jgi:selenocysteine lyase/cysteine desulfurase
MGLLATQRDLFDIPAEVAYFNCAYMSPLPKAALEAGRAANRAKAHPWEIDPEDFFTGSEACRASFARLINARVDDIAIVPSASYGMAMAARNLPVESGQEILVLQDQFPSNVYPWQRLAEAKHARVKTIAKPQPPGHGNASWSDAVLDAISDKTALVALPHCHWTDGVKIDIERIGAKAHEHGAGLVLDITQSGGAMPIDMAAAKPDFLVCACYKWLLGPYALGFLYVDPKWQDGRPIEENWIARRGSEDFTRLIDYQDDYQAGARRFDMGERSSFHLIPMARAALQQLHAWGVDNIQESLAHKTRKLAAKSMELGYMAASDHQRAGHYLALSAPHDLPRDFTSKLAARRIHVSVRGSSLRITPHLYNNDDDDDKLLRALAEMT